MGGREGEGHPVCAPPCLNRPETWMPLRKGYSGGGPEAQRHRGRGTQANRWLKEHAGTGKTGKGVQGRGCRAAGLCGPIPRADTQWALYGNAVHTVRPQCAHSAKFCVSAAICTLVLAFFYQFVVP